MAWVLGIIFIAAMVRCTFGFGEALVSMPLLVVLLGSPVARPLVALLSVTIAAAILLQDWRRVRLRAAGVLLPAAVVGILAGMSLTDRADERLIVAVLGGMLVLYSGFSLWRPDLLELKSDRAAPVFGLVAGMLTAAYNTPGPPLVIYGAMRRLPAEQFRATMQAFFLPTSLAVLVGHGIEQRLTYEVWTYYAAALPVTAVCVFLGGRINRRFTTAGFVPWLHGLLMLMGIALLAKAAFFAG